MSQPESIGDTAARALARATARGPLSAAEAVESIVLKHCPEFSTSWALPYVVALVVKGELPEIALAEALGEFSYSRRRSDNGEGKRVRDPAALLAHVLKRRLAEHGIPWTRPRVCV